MSFSWRRRPIRLLLPGLWLSALLLLAVSAPRAQGAFYDVIFCAAGNGSGNPTLGARPGFFDFNTNCDWAGSYPAGGGTNEFLRLNENTTGAAGDNDEASMSWYAPPWTSIVAGGGFTREPNAFNQGWRARFWGEDWGGGVHNVMLQGSGIEGTGPEPFITKNTTSTFAAHLWPYGGWDDYKRFVFGLWCVRPAGCDRSNFNAVDANSITLVVNDKRDPSVNFVDAAIVRGEWVRGYNPLSWFESDDGSGLRFSRLKVDNATLGDGTIDYEANGGCRIGHRDGGREFGKSLQPCTLGPYQRWYGLETKNISDGQHTLAICLQDYGQYKAGSDSCDRRTIRTDNHAPDLPGNLRVIPANPAFYSDHFDAQFSLPANSGSPITKVHYSVINAKNETVVPEKTLSGTNPTALKNVAGPSQPGDYRLKVWLEDQVGFVGAAASAAIPRDAVPPAAPQDISVTAPATSRAADGFDLRWRNIVDAGSPIDRVHYEILGPDGGTVVPSQTLSGDNIQAIPNLAAPSARGSFALRMWLSDAEGNVGAPATVPLAYSCVRSETGGGIRMTSGLGPQSSDDQVVHQGESSFVSGALSGPDGATANAPVCIYSRISTDPDRSFEGIAMTDSSGNYRFPVASGPSRHFIAVYRSDHREVSSTSRIETIVHPTFKAKKRVVVNKHYARFYGEIPGPHNDKVVVVLQVKSGKGWLAFRRYRTRDGGRFVLGYRFNRTLRPTKYIMRAQVRATTGYPYLQGNSDRLPLKVVPSRSNGRSSK